MGSGGSTPRTKHTARGSPEQGFGGAISVMPGFGGVHSRTSWEETVGRNSSNSKKSRNRSGSQKAEKKSPSRSLTELPRPIVNCKKELALGKSVTFGEEESRTFSDCGWIDDEGFPMSHPFCPDHSQA